MANSISSIMDEVFKQLYPDTYIEKLDSMYRKQTLMGATENMLRDQYFYKHRKLYQRHTKKFKLRKNVHKNIKKDIKNYD